MSKYTVKFNGKDLSVITGIDLHYHNFSNLPTREIKINKIARRDKSIVTSAEYGSKNVYVYMEINGNTRQATENLITQLKAILQPQNQQLTVEIGGEEIEYIATMNEFNIEWNSAIAYVSIVFICSDPIGKATTERTMLNMEGITVSTANYDLAYIEGSATAYPYILVTVNDLTNGTAKSITILNASTFQGMTVTRNWADGDILEIDSETMVVTVNDEVVDFTGMFPEFSAGTQQITYIDDFDARDVDLLVKYKARII